MVPDPQMLSSDENSSLPAVGPPEADPSVQRVAAAPARKRALVHIARASQTAISAHLIPALASQTRTARGQLKLRAGRTADQMQGVGQDLPNLVQVPAVTPQLAKVKGRRLLRDAQEMLKQVRASVDPKEAAGGLVGLTAGEVLGGAVGGIAGAAVAGPAGAIVGAEVGAFAAGTLGLKFGADAVRDFVGTPAAGGAASDMPVADGQAQTATGSYLKRTSESRTGQVIGLAAGASVGRIVAGPRGSLVGALLGAAVGGRAATPAATTRIESATAIASATALEKSPHGGPAEWLDRFGKNTAGEAATVLVGGTLGSIFGPGGRALGQRVGLIVGAQIAWHKLGVPSQAEQIPGARTETAGEPAAVADQNTLPEAQLGEPGASIAALDAAQPAAAVPARSPDPAASLSRREVEVLSILAASMSNREIAARPAILPSMLKSHSYADL